MHNKILIIKHNLFYLAKFIFPINFLIIILSVFINTNLTEKGIIIIQI